MITFFSHIQSALLAYFYWDPNPDIFVLPYFNHPLKWYGLLFMGGVLAGFFILLPLLREKLLRSPNILDRDIASWLKIQHLLAATITDSNSPFYEKFDKQTRHLIQTNRELTPFAKTRILEVLSKFKRQQLETILPGCIVPMKELCFKYVDGLLWWVIIGAIVGARLGHVFFYQWDHYQNHLLDIPKIWEGGLASHGGTVGILLALFFYSHYLRKKFPEITFLALADLVAIPTAFGVVFIRIGNFVNQEILGTPTTLPWGVIFGHPMDYVTMIPRHPVQLYEAFAYLLTFILLISLWKFRKTSWPHGFILGVLFICIYGSRFFLEYLKAPQSTVLDESYLQAGQILSIPFIVLGFGLIYYSQLRSRHGIKQPQNGF